MRLPQPLLDSQFFQFTNLAELLKALEGEVSANELELVKKMAANGLPPITSRSVLAAMLGINSGLIWSFIARPQKHYRTFEIPKGQATRRIDAPRVALKVVQKWISCRLQHCYVAPEHVYGFIPGLSHVDAAAVHCGAEWVFGVDIKDFFQTTRIGIVARNLVRIGFDALGAETVARLCCLRDALAQGAPSSPVLSNICFSDLDTSLAQLATQYQVRLTRYADDIAFSGCGIFPEELRADVLALFSASPWRLADQKTNLAELPNRLKVHGLLVHGEKVRLTKGYRNRIRAYEHLLAAGKIQSGDILMVRGHIGYSDFVLRHA